ncbi:DinB family protein [Deinococcus marmoris]|nr:DinB family protein [Deinococcus marmoris]
MTQPMFDPSVLLFVGHTPEEVRTRLSVELDRMEAHLRGREADWTTTQTGRDWSPAQDAEHIMKIDNSIVPMMRLLMSDKELRPMPQVPGEIIDGKRQSPEALLPSAEGMPFEALDTTWAEHRQKLEEMAAHVTATPGRTFWHQFFGEIDALDWLRMIAMHLRNHRKLLEESAAA